MNPKWLEWGRALQVIAQDGLAYCKNPFDIERYEAIRALHGQFHQAAAEVIELALAGDADASAHLLGSQQITLAPGQLISWMLTTTMTPKSMRSCCCGRLAFLLCFLPSLIHFFYQFFAPLSFFRRHRGRSRLR